MPDEKPIDDIEESPSEEKSMGDRKQAHRRSAEPTGVAIKASDEKLAKLGYHGNSGKPKRSYHEKPVTGGREDKGEIEARNSWRGRAGKVNTAIVPRQGR